MSFIDLVPQKSELVEIKEKLQKELDRQKEEFFKRGGKLTQLDYSASAEMSPDDERYISKKVKDPAVVARTKLRAGIQSSIANKKYKDAK